MPKFKPNTNFKMESPFKIFGDFKKDKTKIKVGKRKHKEKTKITGDKHFSFSLFNFGKK
jgi:hypothetical protein